MKFSDALQMKLNAFASSSSTAWSQEERSCAMMKISAPKIQLDPELTGRTNMPVFEDKMLEFAQKMSFKSVVQKLAGKDLVVAAEAESFSAAKHLPDPLHVLGHCLGIYRGIEVVMSMVVHLNIARGLDFSMDD
ncbi:Uncharacterized protein Fot_33793 [Forsythia ovata]|uniref:Uncharacterized protein n=1 Tax=Forsythia ovata TaxID=205694 RepID=A0ABD1TBU3_9LAMI